MTSDDDLACRDLVEVVTDYIEGDLVADTRTRFEAHLATCAACREYVEQVRATVAAARASGVGHGAPEVPSAILEAFRTWRRR